MRTAFRSTFLWLLQLGLTSLLKVECSFIGIDQPSTRAETDFGPEGSPRLGAYPEDGITRAAVNGMLGSWIENEG